MKLTLNEEIIKDYTGMFRCKLKLLIEAFAPSFAAFIFPDKIKDIEKFYYYTDKGYPRCYDTRYRRWVGCGNYKHGIWPSFKINNSSDFEFNNGQVINYCGFKWIIIKGRNQTYYAYKAEPIMENGEIKEFRLEDLENELALWGKQNGIGKVDKDKIGKIPQKTESEKIILRLASILNDNIKTFYPTSYFKPYSTNSISIIDLRSYIDRNDFQALFEAASCMLYMVYSQNAIETAFADVLGVYVESPKLLGRDLITLSQYLSFSDNQKKILLDAAKNSLRNKAIVFDSFTPDRQYIYFIRTDSPDIIRKGTKYIGATTFNIEILDYNSIRYLHLEDGQPCRTALSSNERIAVGRLGSKYILAELEASNWKYGIYSSGMQKIIQSNNSEKDELIDYPNAVLDQGEIST